MSEEMKNQGQKTTTNQNKVKKTIIAVSALVLIAVLVVVGILLFGKKVKVGDTLTIGHYPQTSAGTDNTPIEWIVLDIQDDQALVISKYALDNPLYNIEYTDVTWETCTLRTWLNNDFINTAFSPKEQDAILQTICINDVEVDWKAIMEADGHGDEEDKEAKSAGFRDTLDKVFLLSCDEAGKYFTSNKSRMVVPTSYAIANGVNGNGTCSWWLRSHGPESPSAAYVGDDGARYRTLFAYYN